MNILERLLWSGCFFLATTAKANSAVFECIDAAGNKRFTNIRSESFGCRELPQEEIDFILRKPTRPVAPYLPERLPVRVWNAPPVVFISGYTGTLPSPDALFRRLSSSIYELTSQARMDSQDANYGSAVAVTPRHALTNCHVVESEVNILVLIEAEGRRLPARLVGANPDTDRCVVEISANSLVPVRAIRSFNSLREGERVYAIGNPRGLTRSISDGLLSGKRTLKQIRVVQTTAPISSGSSGGGLFDSAGNLIGITTAFMSDSQNLNLAIPAEDYWPKSK